MWGRRDKSADNEQGAGPETAPPLSLGDLLKQLIKDFDRLIRSEFRVAQAEFNANLAKAIPPLTLILLGGVLLLGGLFTLMGAIVAWLTLLVGAGFAALIVAVSAGAAGYALISAGRNQMADVGLIPARIAKVIKDDPDAFEGHDT